MENVEIGFSESEWRLFRLIKRIPEDNKITAADLAEQLEDSVRATRRNLAQLAEKEFITPRTFKVTKEGERAYKKHLRWWSAITWLLQSWGLPEEQSGPLADKLLCGTTPQMVEGIMEQNDKARINERPDAESEYIDNTDFYGQIESGSYAEGICFWNLEDNSGYFRRLSPVSDWFSPQSKLFIELEKSRLELQWISNDVQLVGISYYMIGRERFQQPEGRVISLPIMAFSFTRVPRYRMLEGQLDVTVKVMRSGGNDETGEMIRQEYRVRIELPMLFNRSCDSAEKGE